MRLNPKSISIDSFITRNLFCISLFPSSSRAAVMIMEFTALIAPIILTLCLLNVNSVVEAEKLKFCLSNSNKHTLRHIEALCSQLTADRQSDGVKCVLAENRYECIVKLANKAADFTIVEPEDVFVSSFYKEYSLRVTNELKIFSADALVEMVVLVHKSIKSRGDLKGRRLCHSGINDPEGWNKIFSTFFTDWLIPKECDSNKTLLENRLSGIANFFQAACIAGPWSHDSNIDSQLKSKYGNLCALCDNPLGCYSNDKYYGPEGAIMCLTDGVGDVAWARLDLAKEHFTKFGSAGRDEFQFFCNDGTVSKNPCPWLRRPWPLVLAHSDRASEVNDIMTSLLQLRKEWHQRFFALIHNILFYARITDAGSNSPADFFADQFPDYVAAYDRAQCKPSRRVQWCIWSNLEDRKCRQLRDISSAYGIEPEIACIFKSSKAECLDAVAKGSVDLMVVMPEDLLQAKIKGLRSIVRAASKKWSRPNGISAIVRKESKAKSLRDLKGKNACFTNYKSVGWNTFVGVSKVLKLTEASVDTENVANFFADACVPNLPLKDRYLFTLCSNDVANDDSGTLKCLNLTIGDVAFVNLNTLESKNSTLWDPESYKILCPRESESKDGKECILAETALASVMVNVNMTNVRRKEIEMMLFAMDKYFGLPDQGIPSYNLYGLFEGQHDILFPDKAEHLQHIYLSYSHNRIRNSETLILYFIANIYWDKIYAKLYL
ncbi:transferrin isoform X2 [Prorops nasuta]|uniref:transferrin isoform X2 n=1 Tax=Prorops nasuta TaxID=863751 RepID=UPI0034CE9263